MPSLTQRVRWALKRPGAPVVSYAIIALCVAAYLLQLLAPGFTTLMQFHSAYIGGFVLNQGVATSAIPFEPWRVITYGFVHSTLGVLPLHLLLNMYTLWIFGTILEPMLGRGRFITLYVFGLVGGALGVYILSPQTAVIGASGALFALMGALLVIQRRLGGQTTQLLVLLGINFFYGLFVGGVSWQAHLGGLVVGLLAGLILAETRQPKDRTLRIVYFVVLAVVIIVLFAVTPGMLWLR